MLEKTVETYLVDRVRAAGGDAYKFSSPARVSVPDRIVVFPPARIYFVELKRPGGVVTKGQLREHERLRALGCDVRVIDSREAVDAFVREASAHRAPMLLDDLTAFEVMQGAALFLTSNHTVTHVPVDGAQRNRTWVAQRLLDHVDAVKWMRETSDAPAPAEAPRVCDRVVCARAGKCVQDDAAHWKKCRFAPGAPAATEAVGIVHRPAPNGQDFSVEWLKSPPAGKLYAAPQPAAAPTTQPDSATAAILFALSLDDGSSIDFLNNWNEGEFDVLRREWPEAPEDVYIGADPFHPATRGGVA